MSPRFQGENLEHNLDLVSRLRAIAAAKGVTVAQLAFAWVLAQGPDIVPLIGTRKVSRVTEAVGALSIKLEDDELAAISAAVPAGAAARDRYPAAVMSQIDS